MQGARAPWAARNPLRLRRQPTPGGRTNTPAQHLARRCPGRPVLTGATWPHRLARTGNMCSTHPHAIDAEGRHPHGSSIESESYALAALGTAGRFGRAAHSPSGASWLDLRRCCALATVRNTYWDQNPSPLDLRSLTDSAPPRPMVRAAQTAPANPPRRPRSPTRWRDPGDPAALAATRRSAAATTELVRATAHPPGHYPPRGARATATSPSPASPRSVGEEMLASRKLQRFAADWNACAPRTNRKHDMRNRRRSCALWTSAASATASAPIVSCLTRLCEHLSCAEHTAML